MWNTYLPDCSGFISFSGQFFFFPFFFDDEKVEFSALSGPKPWSWDLPHYHDIPDIYIYIYIYIYIHTHIYIYIKVWIGGINGVSMGRNLKWISSLSMIYAESAYKLYFWQLILQFSTQIRKTAIETAQLIRIGFYECLGNFSPKSGFVKYIFNFPKTFLNKNSIKRQKFIRIRLKNDYPLCKIARDKSPDSSKNQKIPLIEPWYI